MSILPTLAMLFAVLCWAFGNVGNKAALVWFEPFELGMLRFGFSAIFLWMLVAATGRWRDLRRVRRAQILLGLGEPFTVGTLLIWGVHFAPASHAVICLALVPVMSPLLSRAILKEPLSPSVSAGAALGIGGVLVLVLGAPLQPGSLIGDGLMVLAMIVSSVGQLFARRVATGGADPVITTTMQITTTTLLTTLLWLAFAGAMGMDPVPEATPFGWGLAIMLGLFGSALPFISYNFAMRSMPVGRVAIYFPLVAPVGAVTAALWLGEALGWNVLVALVLTFGGAALPALGGMLAQRRARR
jgi:drug/metabolite transporter (DMT)-like permease